MKKGVSMSKSGIFTVASRSYLAHVRTLMSSVKEHRPEALRVLIYCDQQDPGIDLSNEDYALFCGQVIELGEPLAGHEAAKSVKIIADHEVQLQAAL